MKVVLMTGYSEAVQGRTESQLAVDAVLSKPFTIDEIAKVVRAALDRAS